MPTSPVVCGKNALPRSLDVNISVSRPQAEIATDMTMICFCTPELTNFPSDNGRVRVYSTLDAVIPDVPLNGAAYFAASAFFARSDRPQSMMLGRIVTTPQPAVLTGGPIPLDSLRGLSGGFDISANNLPPVTVLLGFSASTPTIGSIINQINATASLPFVASESPSGGIVLTTTATGDLAELTFAEAPSGTPALPAALVSGNINLDAVKAVSDGMLQLTINGAVQQIVRTNFTKVTALSDLAALLQESFSGIVVTPTITGISVTTSQSGATASLSYGEDMPDNSQPAEAAQVRGGPLDIAVVKAVTNGAMSVVVDGVKQTVENMDFSSVTDVAGVASVINTAFAGKAVAAANADSISILSPTSGAASTLAYPVDISVTPVPATHGTLVGGTVALSDLTAISDGGFKLTIEGTEQNVSPLNFSACASMSDVAAVIDAALTGGDVSAMGTDNGILTITNTATGDASTITYASAPATGTDVSALLKLTASTATSISQGAAAVIGKTGAASLLKLLAAQGAALTQGRAAVPGSTNMATLLALSEGTAATLRQGAAAIPGPMDLSGLLKLTEATASGLVQGYTPGDIASEMELISKAARCLQKPAYGWVIDAQYRDTEDQKKVADWAEAKSPAYFSTCTNSASAYNTADTSNIGYYCKNKGYKRTSTIYHNNPQVYPDMSYIAKALSVNYSQENSALTMKFKELSGIEPSPITETQLPALISRNINMYVYIGNTSRTVREGVQGLDTWFTDSLVNLDNFVEELQVAVYNVFLRTPKVPYTLAGQNKLVSAASTICNKYTRNGVFADRPSTDTSVESGLVTLPATSIIPTNIAYATVSDRAQRLAPPITIIAYEAGAMHKVNITVDVYN